MDINGWLTVITIIIALVALLPKEELVLTFNSVSKVELWIVGIGLIIVSPYLILFDEISSNFTFLHIFYSSDGVASNYYAFIIFYLALLWLILRVMMTRFDIKSNKRAIQYLKEILIRKPFNDFFALFTKYTSVKNISKYWDDYQLLFYNPNFLKNCSIDNPYYLLQFWDKYSDEDDFRLVLRLFIENENSAYYEEIREHWNSQILLPDKPLLNTLIVTHVRQSWDNTILRNLADFMELQIRRENQQGSIYNQKYVFPRFHQDGGFHLPIYYNLSFIGLLYSTSIERKLDLQTLSTRYNHMVTIFSSIIKIMIGNISADGLDIEEEYPSNYHWLVKEIFRQISCWIHIFEQQDFFPSSYHRYIPSCLSFSLRELYAGLRQGKVSQSFVNQIFYYDIFLDYFKLPSESEIKNQLDELVIQQIPLDFMPAILEFTLDEQFAISYGSFLDGDFGVGGEHERITLDHLRKIVKSMLK